MKWLELYVHQVCIINKHGNTDGTAQLLPEAKQTSWQVFNLFVHVVNELKTSQPTVIGVVGQSDNAGCYV